MYLRRKQWISDFVFEGERHIKSWGEVSKSFAQAKDDKFKTDIREGKHLKKSKRIKFENFADKYLEAAAQNKKKSSVLRNQTSINALMPSFKGKLIEKIHPFEVEKYKKKRRDEGKALATINREIETLKNMMAVAVEWGFLQNNPVQSVKKYKLNNERNWILDEDQELSLLKECDKRPQRKGGEYLKDLVELALYTGMRQAEIFRLKKGDVHLADRFIFVSDSKNGETRNVPLNKTALAILERRIGNEKSDFIFYKKDGGKIKELTNAFWTAVAEAGLERFETDRDNKKKRVRFRFHDLRHTFGSRLGMMGFHPKTIMEIMGHKTQAAAARYQHPTTEHKLNAVNGLDRVPHDSLQNNLVRLKSSVISSG